MTNSIYDKITASGTSATNFKQRVVETFSGDALDTNRWALTDINGGTSGAMDDSVDGGYKVSFSTQASAWGGLTFNNIRPFDLQANDSIFIAKRTYGSAAGGFRAGISNTINTTENNTVTWSSNTSASPTGKFFIWTKTEAEGWSQVKVESTTTIDDNWHVGKLESRSSGVTFVLDGVTAATHGTGQGSVKAQPYITGIGSGTESGRSFSVRYCEVYNT